MYEPEIHGRTEMSRAIKMVGVAALLALGLLLGWQAPPADAAEPTLKAGRETGLPLPRFVSLKRKSVNLRVGPGRKYAIAWQYRAKGLPVEIIQEFDQWRRIRDSDGATGWVLHSLLSSRRMAVVAPWERELDDQARVVKAAFLAGKGAASDDANTVAKPQAGLQVSVERCAHRWCMVDAGGTRFWLAQNQLWGVYPGEEFGG